MTHMKAGMSDLANLHPFQGLAATSEKAGDSLPEGSPKHPRRQTGPAIWKTVLDLAQQGQLISRQRLVQLTCFKLSVIDDHVSRWIDEGRLRRLGDGVYELPFPTPEPRPVSITALPDGMKIIEVGDQELRLWPSEFREVGMLTNGAMKQYGQLQTQSDVAALLAEATVRNRKLADRVSDLERQARYAKRAASTHIART